MSIISERIVANGHGKLSASYLVVHSTANPGATAANHASLWGRQPAYAVHLVSDWKECLHTVPYDRLCWQVGNGNRYVEGIEICEATNRADFDRGIDIAARAVAERLSAHGWSLDRLMTHRDAARKWGGSDHTDPDPYFAKWGYTWEAFRQKVSGYLGGSGSNNVPGSAPGEQDGDEMICCIQPNDRNYIMYCDGHTLRQFGNPDEMEAVNMVYKQTHGGKSIPCFKLGTDAAPWATRLGAVLLRGPIAGI